MDLKNLRGLDLDLSAIIALFGKEKVINTIGLDNMIDIVGREKVDECNELIAIFTSIIKKLEASP
jgi:hypothetical protein